jgi:hypothetical protein
MESLFRKTVFRGIIYSLIFFQANALISAERPSDEEGKPFAGNPLNTKCKGGRAGADKQKLFLSSLINPVVDYEENNLTSSPSESAAVILPIPAVNAHTPVGNKPNDDRTSTEVSVEFSSNATPGTQASSPLKPGEEDSSESTPVTIADLEFAKNTNPRPRQSRRRSSSCNKARDHQTVQASPVSPLHTPEERSPNVSPSPLRTEPSIEAGHLECCRSSHVPRPLTSEEALYKAIEAGNCPYVKKSFGRIPKRGTVADIINFHGYKQHLFINSLAKAAINHQEEIMQYLLGFTTIGSVLIMADIEDASIDNSIFYCSRDNQKKSLIEIVINDTLGEGHDILEFIKIIFSEEYLKLRNYGGEAVITESEVKTVMVAAIQQNKDDLLLQISDLVLHENDADRNLLITLETMDEIISTTSSQARSNCKVNLDKMVTDIQKRDQKNKPCLCTIL